MKIKISILLLTILCFMSLGYADELVSPALTPDPTIELRQSMSVRITSDRKQIMWEGDIIHLTSVLTGFEWCEEITYQWECDKNDGAGFQIVDGATADHYEFPATHETLTWSWRLVVNYR